MLGLEMVVSSGKIYSFSEKTYDFWGRFREVGDRDGCDDVARLKG